MLPHHPHPHPQPTEPQMSVRETQQDPISPYGDVIYDTGRFDAMGLKLPKHDIPTNSILDLTWPWGSWTECELCLLILINTDLWLITACLEYKFQLHVYQNTTMFLQGRILVFLQRRPLDNNNFLARKCTWNIYCLQNGGHFVPNAMC